MRVTIHLTSLASITHYIYDLNDIAYVAALKVAGRGITEDTMIIETSREKYEYEMNHILRIEIFPRG